MPYSWRDGQDEDFDDYERLVFSDDDADEAREHNYWVEETV